MSSSSSSSFSRSSSSSFERRRVFCNKKRKQRKRVEEKILTQSTPTAGKESSSSSLETGNVTLGTMTFGNQNNELEAHEQMNIAYDEYNVKTIDTAEMYAVPFDERWQGKTDEFIGSWMKGRGNRSEVCLLTKVAGRSEMKLRGREKGEENRLTEKQIIRSVECSLERLQTDYVDLLQIHWPDRYVSLFGQKPYERKNERSDDEITFEEQASAMQKLIESGKVRFSGLSNETSFGVSEFASLSKYENKPKMQTIQNGYNLLQRIAFETDLNETCSKHNVLLLAYSPLAGGALTGKYLDEAAPKNSRFNLFPGYMSRFNDKNLRECLFAYRALAIESGMSLTELSLRFVRDRDFVHSTVIGATSTAQLRENLKALLESKPLSADINLEIERIYRKYRDPAQLL